MLVDIPSFAPEHREVWFHAFNQEQSLIYTPGMIQNPSD